MQTALHQPTLHSDRHFQRFQPQQHVCYPSSWRALFDIAWLYTVHYINRLRQRVEEKLKGRLLRQFIALGPTLCNLSPFDFQRRILATYSLQQGLFQKASIFKRIRILIGSFLGNVCVPKTSFKFLKPRCEVVLI
jgi:hypothetical protein